MTLEELQEVVGEDYDLTKVEDCRTLIGILLKGIEAHQAQAKTAHGKLKLLSVHCVKDRHDAARKFAEGVLEGVELRGEAEVLEELLGMCDEIRAAESLEDGALIDEVMTDVWGELPFTSRESAVLEELIRRYKKAKGIPVNGNGDDERGA